MAALAAFVCLIVAFILQLLGTSTGKFSLLLLGLAFMALHLLWPVGFDRFRRT